MVMAWLWRAGRRGRDVALLIVALLVKRPIHAGAEYSKQRRGDRKKERRKGERRKKEEDEKSEKRLNAYIATGSTLVGDGRRSRVRLVKLGQKELFCVHVESKGGKRFKP